MRYMSATLINKLLKSIMSSFENAAKALEKLLTAMEHEAVTPVWYATEDHPKGGYELLDCSIAPFMNWLWYRKPFVGYAYGREAELGKYGLLALDFTSIKTHHFENIVTLLRYLREQPESYRDSLIALEGGDGSRIEEALIACDWLVK